MLDRDRGEKQHTGHRGGNRSEWVRTTTAALCGFGSLHCLVRLLCVFLGGKNMPGLCVVEEEGKKRTERNRVVFFSQRKEKYRLRQEEE